MAALAQGDGPARALRSLTGDPDALDRLLDDPALFARLLEAPHLLHVSPWFFYYVVVRRTLLDHGIEDRVVADYVGALLSFHLQRREAIEETVYLVDLVQAMAGSRSEEEAFRLRAAIGDRALYLTGVFPDWIHHRHVYGRRPVDLDYYESMGSRHYSAAARSAPARMQGLGPVLEYLGGAFPLVRQALNDLVDEHLHLAPKPAGVEALLRRALHRVRN